MPEVRQASELDVVHVNVNQPGQCYNTSICHLTML